jgi:mycofactocin precursor
MADTTTIADDQVATDHADSGDAEESVEEFIEDELLVEEISIDGMCGVY